MFREYNIRINSDEMIIDLETYYDIGIEKLYREKEIVHNKLHLLMKNRVIDGDELQKLFFPSELFSDGTFVFISHSHKDEHLAICLAGYLYKNFKIESFVDSCVWSNLDDLIYELNGCDSGCHNCLCEDFLQEASYAHIMLASALMDMIDRSKSIFFLNTEYALNCRNKTNSPWIYYELNFADMIVKRERDNQNCCTLGFIQENEIEFTPKVDRMFQITEKELKAWKKLHELCGGNPFEELDQVIFDKKDK